MVLAGRHHDVIVHVEKRTSASARPATRNALRRKRDSSRSRTCSCSRVKETNSRALTPHWFQTFGHHGVLPRPTRPNSMSWSTSDRSLFQLNSTYLENLVSKRLFPTNSTMGKMRSHSSNPVRNSLDRARKVHNKSRPTTSTDPLAQGQYVRVIYI